MAETATATKVCTGCHQEKPFSDFTADASKADGRHTRCKQCRASSDRAAYLRREQERRELAESLGAEEREALLVVANREALLMLLKNHQNEFISLRERALARIAMEKKPKGSWVEKVDQEIPLPT